MVIKIPDKSNKPVTQKEYPVILRMGHTFETSLGHRHYMDGFKLPISFAIGGDDWYYVLCKHLLGPAIIDVRPKVHIAPVNFEDEYKPHIFLTVDGKKENKTHREKLPGPSMLDSDKKDTLFMTDEHANKIA